MLYLIFSRYYLQGVAEVEGPQLLKIMQGLASENGRNKDTKQNNTNNALIDESFKKGIFHLEQHLEQVAEDDSIRGEAVFDYNRLFIGPDKRLAPPYESVYCNPQRLLMQAQTLQVKKIYQELGLQNKQKGSMPEDHLGLELEFIAYLLHLLQTATADNQQEEAQRIADNYKQFFEEHIYNWVFTHCQEVVDKSATNFNKAIGYLLNGLITMEKEGVL